MIKTLPGSVISKIAAGEVIERPSSAIKELIENALDASATLIKIEIDSASFANLNITDNGNGIFKEDLPLLCKRHATSKIENYDDIKRVSTFGFRGEAMASISSVSKVTVTTKTASEKVAYKVSYSNGVMEGVPQPLAGLKGTTIAIENFFFNVPLRRNVFKKTFPAERAKCFEIVKKYAINNPKIDFSYKREKKSNNSLCSPHSKEKACNSLTMIKLFYQKSITDSLTNIFRKRSNEDFSFEGYVSTPSMKISKQIDIIFINKRLVSWSKLLAETKLLFKSMVHSKFKVFLYISLSLNPQKIDVNVHPQKEEVLIMKEEVILKAILNEIKSKFFQDGNSNDSKLIKQLDFRMERRSLFPKVEKGISPKKQIRLNSNKSQEGVLCHRFKVSKRNIAENTKNDDFNVKNGIFVKKREKCRNKVILESIQRLSKEFKCNRDDHISEIMKNFIYVGHINNDFILIQFRTKLINVNINKICRLIVKEKILENFSVMKYQSINECDMKPKTIEQYIKETFKQHIPSDKLTLITKKCSSKLVSHRQMLEDYFSIEISEKGEVISLPFIATNIAANKSLLGQFFASISSSVCWDDENDCLKGIIEILSRLYSFYFPPNETREEIDFRIKTNVIPLLRKVAPKKIILTENIVVEIGNTERFYSSFERC